MGRGDREPSVPFSAAPQQTQEVVRMRKRLAGKFEGGEKNKRSLAGEIFADGMSLLQSSCYQARQTRISTAYKRDHKHHSSDYFVRKKML